MDKPKDKNTAKSREEQEKDAIAKGLGALKAAGRLKAEKAVIEDTLESKMPSRSENQEVDEHQEIKIPRAKRFEEEAPEEQKQDTAIPKKEQAIEVVKSPVQDPVIKGIGQSVKQITPDNSKKIAAAPNVTNNIGKKLNSIKTFPRQDASILQQPGFVEDKLGVQAKTFGDNKKAPSGSKKNEDQSIFGDKPEVSKIELKHEMRTDPKIWQASRQVGLTLSPVERSKLVKDVFSPALGRNISKTDLKWSIKKLNQKMLGAKDHGEHAKIRKEIKFFKKIGGIK